MIASERQGIERAVRLRDAHRLSLAAIELGAAPKAAMQAGGLQPFLAVDASSIGPGEWRGDQIADLSPLAAIARLVASLHDEFAALCRQILASAFFSANVSAVVVGGIAMAAVDGEPMHPTNTDSVSGPASDCASHRMLRGL